jgi:V/A-type H+-transporting ATPase subunit I
MTDKEHIEALRSLLETEQLPELETPEELAGLSFTERARALRRRREECRKQLAAVAAERNVFALRWRPIYRAALTWLESRLSVFQASSAAYQTRSCFFILGWVFSSEVPAIRDLLEQRFSGQVVTSERKLLVEDYQLAPVVLKNPPYFEPFELLTSLLPLPRYSSYDPTPFIGLFFPLLFGMTLGDVGYGLILILVSLGLIYGCSQRKALVAAGKILGICAVYTVLFGLLFGELFGDLGQRLWNLHPLWFDRAESFAPMIVFALSVGFGHVLIGMLLGIWSDWKIHRWREAVLKITSALLLILVGLLVVDLLHPQQWLPTAPMLVGIAALLPLLIAVGGLLAPLELLKGIGNVISYVRIMAIGLSSVLLAYVANRLGGMTGDVVLGILVAGLLHSFNLLLGVFAPTVHVLRLHYVEFFSKFLELGGRRFQPLGKKPPL